jgi:hypothetical protein
MDFQTYQQHFQHILANANPAPPYNNPAYIEYTKLNWARMNRWLKKAVISEELLDTVKKIDQPQRWIIITEPWCGDAAHSVPVLHLISLLNPLITVDYQLRDSEPFLINAYMTNGGKSIPKLIIRTEAGADLVTWGPRPANCQVIYARLSAEKAPFPVINTALQNWYNEFASTELQQELTELLQFASVFPGQHPAQPIAKPE